MKVCVYAICKNEEKFVTRWIDSMKEADQIVVLDTGSTDNTISLLEQNGVIVFKKNIKPWRFDTARNICLSYLDKDVDICVCTDLDEVFESGWRKKIEDLWKKNKCNQMSYKYVWSHTLNGDEGITFYAQKIHARHNFTWIHPVHEVLQYTGSDKNIIINATNVTLHHYPDDTKSRSQYLPLLKLAVKEDKNNDRNMHYLGRELMFNFQYKDAIKVLKKHLSMPNANWDEERCASLRYIAKSYFMLNQINKADKFYNLACIESPHSREPRYEYAIFLYSQQNYIHCLTILHDMFKIEKRNLTYISNPECWGAIPYDIASLCYYYIGNIKQAITYSLKALSIDSNNKRILDNILFFNQELFKSYKNKK